MHEYEIKFFLFERPLRMKVVAENEDEAVIELRKRVLKNVMVVDTQRTQPDNESPQKGGSIGNQIDDLLNAIFGK